jgi:hypothetical protein
MNFNFLIYIINKTQVKIRKQYFNQLAIKCLYFEASKKKQLYSFSNKPRNL